MVANGDVILFVFLGRLPPGCGFVDKSVKQTYSTPFDVFPHLYPHPLIPTPFNPHTHTLWSGTRNFSSGLASDEVENTWEFGFESGVLRGSVVKCLTRNPRVLGSSCTGSSGFFHGSVLGQDTSEPQPSTGETQERHE